MISSRPVSPDITAARSPLVPLASSGPLTQNTEYRFCTTEYFPPALWFFPHRIQRNFPAAHVPTLWSEHCESESTPYVHMFGIACCKLINQLKRLEQTNLLVSHNV